MKPNFFPVRSLAWLLFLTGSALSAETLVEYPQVKQIQMDRGHLVLEEATASAKVVKRVTASESVNVSAHLDTKDGRFYLTDWSLAQRRAGKRCFWVFDPAAKASSADQSPVQVAAGEWRKALLRYPAPREISAPHGYLVLASSAVEKGQERKVVNRGPADSSLKIAAELRTEKGTLYVSDWSLERFDKGVASPNWIILIGEQLDRVPAIAAEPPLADKPKDWPKEFNEAEQKLFDMLADEMGSNRGRLAVARDLHPRLSVRLGESHRRTLQIQVDLALLEIDSGNILRGKRLLVTALTRGAAKVHPLGAARAHYALGDYFAADPLFGAALADPSHYSVGALDLDPGEVIDTRLKLGARPDDKIVDQVLRSCDRPDEMLSAAKAFREGGFSGAARSLLEKAMAKEDNGWEKTTYLLELAQMMISDGDTASAKPLIETLTRIVPSKATPENAHEVDANAASLAFLLAKLGRNADARRFLDASIEATVWNFDFDEEHRDMFGGAPGSVSLARELGLDAEWTEPVVSQAVEVTRRVANHVLAQNDEESAEDFLGVETPASAGSARWTAEALLHLKGAMVERRITHRRLEAACQSGKPKQLLTELRALEEQYVTGFTMKHESLSVPMERKIDAVWDELRALLGPEIVPARTSRVTVAQVCKALPAKAALVEFFTYSRGYAAVVLRPDAAPVFVDCGPAHKVAMLIDEFRSAADPAAQERRSAEHLERDLEKTARELYRLIVAPIEKELPADTSEVILSPAGHLNFVSLSALIADDGRFWAEKRRLHFVSSGRDLLRSPATMSKAAPSLLVGAPDFQLANAADGTIAAPGKDGFVGSLIVAVRGTRETATELSQAFSDLEGTRTELTLVEDILKKAGFSVEARSDANATERNLRAISSPPILHLATHGFFFDQLAVGSGTANRLGEAITDPMLLGGVALAGIKNTFAAWERGRMPPPEDDGFLCAYEAANLKLDGTFLVTLSACETGLGEATGSNGVLGLKRGFLQAGAKNLLHTLWKVADVETVEFMRQFYTAVAAGQHPSHALIETQRTLLAKWRRERGLRAAINLAGPFVLTSGTAIPEK